MPARRASVGVSPRIKEDIVPVMAMLGLALLALALTVRYAGASPRLPFSITCEQVVRYAADLNIPNTFRGRMQARIIALSFGHVLTNAELSAAAACLTEARAK